MGVHRYWRGGGVFAVVSTREIELFLLVKRVMGCQWMGYSWMGWSWLVDGYPVRRVGWLSHCLQQLIRPEW